MKYTLKSLSVSIKGRLFRKEEAVIFDTEGKHKSMKTEVENAAKAGFLVEVEESKEDVKPKAKKKKSK